MSFISPITLMLLLPLGGIIVLLYLLKLKRREQTVSSIFLWQDAVADIQANSPFQKLKKSLLLLLQLTALLLLLTAAARPYLRVRGAGENRIVVILDSSASMKATDVALSRFEQAKSRALDIVRRMGPGDTMLVMTAGSKTRVVASSTSDKRALTSAITSLRPVDTPCNMRQAMVLALSLVGVKSSAPPRIVVLSDGGFGEMTNLSASGAKLDFIRIGRRNDNAAITGISSRKSLSGSQQVFISLKNYAAQPKHFNLDINLGAQLLDTREENLKPGETRQEVLDGVDSLSGRVTARLDIADDLAADNFGSVYLSKPRKLSVLLVSKGNLFLQNALNLDQRVQLSKSEAAPADLAKSGYDLVVFDGIKPPSALPPGGYLLINTACAQGPAEAGDSVDRPRVVDSSREHPSSAYVDFSNLAISKAHILKPRNWATTIVEGEKGPLGVAGSNAGLRFVQISFDVLGSDFPLRVGFPIFIANCLDWLAPSNGAGSGESVRTGQPAYVDLPPNATQAAVTFPDGRNQTVRITQTPLVFEDTECAGVYQVRVKGAGREFACNLTSSSESSIQPRDVLSIGGKALKANTGAVHTNRELYGFLILAALALLTFEWYAYHRRI
jgi:Ca-activated chloride channel homolog